MKGESRAFPTAFLWIVSSNTHKDGCAPRGPSSARTSIKTEGCPAVLCGSTLKGGGLWARFLLSCPFGLSPLRPRSQQVKATAPLAYPPL